MLCRFPSARIHTMGRITCSMITVIDCNDSYTYNLVAMFRSRRGDISVVNEHDAGCVRDTDAVVLSPGPGRPSPDRGSWIVAERFLGIRPVFGVCLGHQTISAVSGGRVEVARSPSHGELVRILHSGRGLFEGVPNGFRAVRYNSLTVSADAPGFPMTVDAKDGSGDVMAISDEERSVYGVQFHPESFMTEYGGMIIDNFIEVVEQWRRR